MPLKIKIEDTPTITSRGGEINILISPGTVGSNHLVMGYSQLNINERVTPHIHDYSEEAFFVLEGQGRIHFAQTSSRESHTSSRACEGSHEFSTMPQLGDRDDVKSEQPCAEDDFIDFKQGDAVLVPKGKAHWIENTGSQIMKVIFAVSPLAPTPGAGHREVELNQKEYV